MSIHGGNFYKAFFDWKGDAKFNWKKGLTFTEDPFSKGNFEIDSPRNQGDINRTLHAAPSKFEAKRYTQQDTNAMILEAITELTGIDPSLNKKFISPDEVEDLLAEVSKATGMAKKDLNINLKTGIIINIKTGDLIIYKQDSSEENPFIEASKSNDDNPNFRLETQKLIANEYLKLYAENTSEEVRRILYGPIFGFMQIQNHAAQEYFAQLHSLASFGDDVVKDIRKQIVELKYAYPGLSDVEIDRIVEIHSFIVELNNIKAQNMDDLKVCAKNNQFIKNLFELNSLS